MDTLVNLAPVLMILFISLAMISYGLRMVILTAICVLVTALSGMLFFFSLITKYIFLG
ncbi:hypothetical protein ACTHAJ_000384 [Enterobacter soli]